MLNYHQLEYSLNHRVVWSALKSRGEGGGGAINWIPDGGVALKFFVLLIKEAFSRD